MFFDVFFVKNFAKTSHIKPAEIVHDVYGPRGASRWCRVAYAGDLERFGWILAKKSSNYRLKPDLTPTFALFVPLFLTCFGSLGSGRVAE